MEQQGAVARYANLGDDENSQAEGTTNPILEGAIGGGYVRPLNADNNVQNPHYENIYESIDHAAVAPIPAENNNSPNVSSNSNRLLLINRQNIAGSAHAGATYRNELPDRSLAYDVPRQINRNGINHGPNRRPYLDTGSSRMRYSGAQQPQAYRQRSFDDTESYHYAHGNGNYNGCRYENIYEQIHEEPIYRNSNGAGTSSASNSGANRMYGRLDVIGHGIGRIERHLSSSCGNIDHYNLGSHYAVLGHSHLGTVGHIRLNAGHAPTNAKETAAGKTTSFFSCLGRENSQSMSNICTGENANEPIASQTPSNTINENAAKMTGAIPKIPKKLSTQNLPEAPLPVHASTFNRIPKSSLQWLLMNKWLPLWIGNGPDCNVVGFNFMFSRNCDGCNSGNGEIADSGQPSLFQYHPDNDARRNYVSRRYMSTKPDETTVTTNRPMRLMNYLSRFREDRRYVQRDGSLPNERARYAHAAHNCIGKPVNNTLPREYHARDYVQENASRIRQMHGNRFQRPTASDPFRRWELNSENNSFRPAVRRITDGTFPNRNNQLPDKSTSPEAPEPHGSDNAEDDEDAARTLHEFDDSSDGGDNDIEIDDECEGTEDAVDANQSDNIN